MIRSRAKFCSPSKSWTVAFVLIPAVEHGMSEGDADPANVDAISLVLAGPSSRTSTLEPVPSEAMVHIQSAKSIPSGPGSAYRSVGESAALAGRLSPLKRCMALSDEAAGPRGMLLPIAD